MKYLPLEIASNLMEYWSLVLLAQYVCSAHMEPRRRNAFLCPGLCVIGTILAILFPSDYSFVVSGALVLLLTVLLFSKKRLSDLLRLLAAFALWYVPMLTPMLFLEIPMPRSLVPIFPDHTCTWFGLITDICGAGIKDGQEMPELCQRPSQVTAWYHPAGLRPD